jgi:hypothetical protein
VLRSDGDYSIFWALIVQTVRDDEEMVRAVEAAKVLASGNGVLIKVRRSLTTALSIYQ